MVACLDQLKKKLALNAGPLTLLSCVNENYIFHIIDCIQSFSNDLVAGLVVILKMCNTI